MEAFPIAVRAADMTDDLGKLLDWGLEEHFCGQGASVELLKGRGQSCAGGVPGGAGWLSFPLRQHHGTTRAHTADLN